MVVKRSATATIVLLFLSAVLFVPASVCAPDKDALYGGTLVWGTYNKPTLINPVFTTHSISAPLELLIFNRLVRLNSGGEVEPDLAESWSVSEDGLLYTFNIRKGVRFHDGVECTAKDVKFTYDKIIEPAVNSPFRSFFAIVKEFRAPTPYTFQVELKKPSPSFIYRMMKEIAPMHLLENIDLRSADFNFHPVGTGPFKFREWSKDNQITLEANRDYYEGRPYLDEIVIKTYQDSRQLWSALMRQEVDLDLFLEREDYEVVKKDRSFKGYTTLMDSYYAVVYNISDPVLSDKRVREAVAYGIDRQNLIQIIAFGYGREATGPFYPDSVGFNPKVLPFEFNPEKSKELLAQAGWSDSDDDGVLERGGEELQIRILVDERNDLYRRIVMLIRQELQRIGIKLIVQLYNDDSQLTPQFLEQNKPQAQLKFLLAGIDPDQITEEWLLHNPERIGNLLVYDNPEVSRYFVLGKVCQDKAKKAWIYQEIHRMIYTDQPACFLYFPCCFHAVSSKFRNTDNLFNLSMPHQVMKEWYIDKEALKKERR